jgi:hypothetical protein
MKPFELTEEVLQEKYDLTVLPELDVNNKIYQDLDEIVEGAIHQLARLTILNSPILEESVKVKALEKLEDYVITPEQICNFELEVIGPAIHLCGIDEENYEDLLHVPAIILELAHLSDYCSNKVVDENTLRRSIDALFEVYGIPEDPKLRDMYLEIGDKVSKLDLSKVRPEPVDIIEAVLTLHMLDDELERLEENNLPEGERIKSHLESSSSKIRDLIRRVGEYRQWGLRERLATSPTPKATDIGEIGENIKKLKSLASVKSIGHTIAAAALISAGIIAYRTLAKKCKDKDSEDRIECLIKACDSGIAAAKKAMSDCDNEDTKCISKIQSQIESFEKRKKELQSRLRQEKSD